LIWNVRRTDESDFSRGYEQLLLQYGTEYPQIRERHTDEDSSAFFAVRTFTAANSSTSPSWTSSC